MKAIEDLDLENGRGVERAPATFLPDPSPRKVWCPIISADDHVLEPPDLFCGRVPKRLRADAPRVDYDDDGVPYRIICDPREPMRLTTCRATGRPIEDWKKAPYFDALKGLRD